MFAFRQHSVWSAELLLDFQILVLHTHGKEFLSQTKRLSFQLLLLVGNAELARRTEVGKESFYCHRCLSFSLLIHSGSFAFSQFFHKELVFLTSGKFELRWISRDKAFV